MNDEVLLGELCIEVPWNGEVELAAVAHTHQRCYHSACGSSLRRYFAPGGMDLGSEQTMRGISRRLKKIEVPEDGIRIRCEGVTKYYQRTLVLDSVDLEVHRGTMLGLIGPGASGKSLLVKIICGLIPPDEGRVFIDGIDITELRELELQALRMRLGMVFQNYALFDFMNVGENIALPLRMEGRLKDAVIRERVAEILEQVALPGIEEKAPNELSGGMKKRVSFARAVIRRPPIVIYDDPTAGLDPVTSAKIFRLLSDMQDQGTTSVTISHDLEGIRPLCDRWMLLNHGQCSFSGDTEAFDSCEIPFVRQFWRGDLV